MIIDSHAHYAHFRYDTEVPYLGMEEGALTVRRGDREALLADLRASGIVAAIEPSIGFEALEKQRERVTESEGFLWEAIGVHPTRCIHTPWKARRTVSAYAESGHPIAIGETGLDYHHPRRLQHRLRQKLWFIYQIKLADRLGLPLILHIREGDRDALRILKRYKDRLHGGVVHCFGGDHRLAQEYIALGFAIGVGGKLLCENEEGRALGDTVKNVKLRHLLVETDAPYVLPEEGLPDCSGNQRKKLCNSSLILPAVISRIARIRGEEAAFVEEQIYQNTVALFHLNIGEEPSEKRSTDCP
ncbi:MAG: TatD family hydrolase [Clostridia bacterium]|nr:TatD family hydrolase [Clostridia bacterium]